MIRLAFAVILCTFSFAMSAQTITGSLKEFALFGKANIEVIFADASIHGMQEEDFAAVERDWYKDKPEIVYDFIGGVAEKLKVRFTIGTRLSTPYQIKVYVQNISKKGDYTCDAIVFKEDVEIASIKSIKADGGTFGTKLNLIKDGAEHTGEKLGKLLSKEIKKIRKQ